MWRVPPWAVVNSHNTWAVVRAGNQTGIPRFSLKLCAQFLVKCLASDFSLLCASFCPSRIMEITHSLEILKHTRLMSAEPLETFRWKLPQQHKGLFYFKCEIYLDISLNTWHLVHFPQTRCSRQPWDKHTPQRLPLWALNLMNHGPDSPLALTQGSISKSVDIDYVIWCKASIKRESTPNSCLPLKLDLLAISFPCWHSKKQAKPNSTPSQTVERIPESAHCLQM